MWRDILKEKISLLEILNEEIEEGYTITVTGENMLQYTVKADKHAGLEFHLSDLHYNLTNAVIRAFLEDSEFAESVRRESNINLDMESEETKKFIFQVKAAVRGLEFFLGSVAENGDLDRIRGTWIKSMTVESPTGVILKFRLSKDSNCDANIQYGGKLSTMCLQHSISNEVPAAGDAWYGIYTLFNMAKEESMEDTITYLTNKGQIPNVIKTAYDAVKYDDYIRRCGHCSNSLDENEMGRLLCDNCGYNLHDEEEADITSEEDDDARVEIQVNGWHCPYDNEFTEYGNSCDEHNVKPSDDGPHYGYTIDYAAYLDRIGVYMVEGENLFVTDPQSGDYIEYTKDELLEGWDLEDLLIDFKELFGDVEDGIDFLNIGPWEEVGDDISFERRGTKYIYRNRTNTLEPYDERFDEMEGHILSSGIDVDFNRDIPFEDALDEAIGKVEEMIFEGEFVEEEPNWLGDAKKLLLELQSMR
jgi:hypothetical protein